MTRRPSVFALALLACGPRIEHETPHGTESTDDATTTVTTTGGATTYTSDTTADPTTTTQSTTPLPTTDPTTLDTTTIDPSSETTGCTDRGGVESCDPWLQDCCAGSKCVAWGVKGVSTWTAVRCSPVADDPDAIGNPCTVEGSAISGIDSCEAGAFCFYVDPETNAGTCVAVCTGTPDAPICDDPDTSCAIEFGDFITLCLHTCDPLLDDCDVGVCAPSGDAFVCGLALDDTAIGEQCWHHWECASGGICTSADRLTACEGERCCAPVCDTTLAQPCEDGLVCDPWYPDADPPIGVCTAV